MNTVQENTVVGVTNPLDRDFTPKWDGKYYPTIKSGDTVPFPYDIAKYFAMKLAKLHIQETMGIENLTNKGLLEDETEKLIKNFEITTINTDKVQSEDITEIESIQKSEESAFQSLNERDEEIRKELLKENNPKQAEAEDLYSKTNAELRKIAKSLNVEGGIQSMTKKELVESIIKVN